MSKRIVIDCRELMSSTGRYMRELLLYLQRLDTENEYYVLMHQDGYDKFLLDSKNFHKVLVTQKKFSLAEQTSLPGVIKSLDPDLVHFTMPNQPAFLKYKRVTTIHDLTPLRFTDPASNPLVFKLRQLIFRWLVKRVARKSSHVITPSSFTKDDVAAFANIGLDKITAIPLSADLIADSPKPIENLENQKFIFYVGRAQAHKNLERLVKSFEIINASDSELKLVLAGKKGTHYDKLEKLAANSLARSSIIFTGFVSDAELKWMYQNAKAYVFPSLSEGFGLPGLEAMAHDCPVVSSNATCLPEVYQDAAVYFDPTNAKDMAEKIQAVLDDPKLARELTAKGQKLLQQYSWEKTARETLAVYNSLLHP